MILLTGGAGYIGSHMALALLRQGKQVVVLDNLIAGSKRVFNSACQLAGGHAEFVRGDIRDPDLLNSVFSQYDINAVIHTAGLKSIAASVHNPLACYDNNVIGTLNLLKVMQGFGVKKLLFSSSITACTAINPYGHSKQVIDDMLKNLASSDKTLSFTSVRYANPIGCYDAALADTSQDNLLPAIIRVANGKQDFLTIFGDDYDTPDGTAMRDYVHILDVIDANLLAFDYLANNQGYYCWQVGSGKSASVKQVLEVFTKQTCQRLPYAIKARRSGDIADSRCDIRKTHQKLGWQPKRSVGDAIASIIKGQEND